MNEHLKLEQLIKRYFDDEDRQSPTSATAVGIHDFDHMLEDFSPMGISRMKESLKTHRQTLDEIDFDQLDDQAKIKYHLMDQRMESSRLFIETTRPYQKDPAFYSEFSIQSVFLLLMREFAPLSDRLEAASDRMDEIPRLLESAMENLDNPPEVFTRVAIEMVEGAGALYDSLIPRMAQDLPKVRDKVMASKDRARAALKKYRQFLENDLLPRSKGDFAIGAPLMDKILTGENFLDYGSEELWKVGSRELELCEQKIERFVRDEYKTQRPWREVFRETKENHPPADKLLATYVEYLQKARQFVEENHVVKFPGRETLKAMDTPKFSRVMTPHAAYMPPAAFEEDQTGYLMVTPVDTSQPVEQQEAQLRDSSYGKIQYVSLHEAYPGHHLQLVYANSITDPLIKRTMNGIFIEGWAFYCEEIMNQLGYLDREGKLCQLEAAYWRALRILLDVGLHTRRFNLDGAYEFLKSKVDWSPIIAKSELKRYTRMPTQALSYYTGKLEIFGLRDKYKEKAGGNFDMGSFHQDLLSCGALPPKVIGWKLGLSKIPGIK